jgi:hypothetical protein
VGIVPAHEYQRRRRLWGALQDAYPVRFEGREAGVDHDLDGVIAIGAGDPILSRGLPCLHAVGEEPRAGGSRRSLALRHHAALARPLRGARLGDGHARALEPEMLGGHEVVLATLDGLPAWAFARDGALLGHSVPPLGAAPRHRVSCAPAELHEGEALRERLGPGRCLALLALAHFLGDLTAGPRRELPPLRAAFVIDDPNLHWPSYGHLDYAELLRHARAHGYHLAVAMAPLDGWLAHPRAVRLFREGSAELSVCVHGNDHDGPELGRPRSKAESLALVAQALRRAAAFERRTGVTVDRVMVPPHERVGEPVARALLACGFQALCTTRPYPWTATSLGVSWLTRPPDAGPLAAWGPVDVVAGGLPVLLRADFAYPREDLVLRAFLGQPLLLYGHQDLLRHGPDQLAEAAAAIDRLGEVRWSSLASIARAHAPGPPAGGVLGPSTLATIPSPPPRLRPILRRLASEGRDRAQAAVASRHPLRREPGRAGARAERSRSSPA